MFLKAVWDGVYARSEWEDSTSGESGTVARMETYLSQLQQIGAFEQIAGILLGTFTEMEAKQCMPDIVQLVKKYVRKTMPIAVTKQIGHGTDAKGIVIGGEL